MLRNAISILGAASFSLLLTPDPALANHQPTHSRKPLSIAFRSPLKTRAQPIVLQSPPVRIDARFKKMQDDFAVKLQSIAAQDGSQGALRTVLAPFGGTKISPFHELDADVLVILDWNRPGSLSDILASFSERDDFQKVLQAAVSDGAMHSIDVSSVPVASQLLGRLHHELGVQAAEVSWWLPLSMAGNISNPEALLSGPPVDLDDAPLVFLVRFPFRGRDRVLAFVSYQISSDRLQSRSPMPVPLLQSLLTTPFSWAYVAADGVGLFSANPVNGLRKASQQLLGLLQNGGAVVLDYPTHRAYTSGDKAPNDLIVFMQGRAPLEPWGLKRVETIPAPPPYHVFGYTGYTSEDSIRVYRKGTIAEIRTSADQAGQLSLRGFRQIGEAARFVLR